MEFFCAWKSSSNSLACSVLFSNVLTSYFFPAYHISATASDKLFLVSMFAHTLSKEYWKVFKTCITSGVPEMTTSCYWVTLKMASFLPRLNPIYNEWFRLPVLWHLKCSVLKHQLSLFVLRRIFWKNKVIVGIFEHEEGWTKFGAKMYYLRGAGSCGMLRKRIQRHSHR